MLGLLSAKLDCTIRNKIYIKLLIMNNNLVIKNATKNDVPTILAFIRELAEYEKLLHEVVATEEILTETLFGNNPRAEVIIAFINEQPVGFALYFYNYSTFLARPGIYIEDLYVKPECRGMGLGKKLLAYLARLCIQNNCPRLQWWVLDWNQDAINFYERIGAKAMDEWTVYRVSGAELEKLGSQ
jgi:GNAT superfamily N-acetyltransferase